MDICGISLDIYLDILFDILLDLLLDIFSLFVYDSMVNVCGYMVTIYQTLYVKIYIFKALGI